MARQADLLRPRRVILAHHDDWLPGFSVPTRIAPIREAMAHSLPRVERGELGSLSNLRTCSSSTRGQGSHIIEDVGFLGIEGASRSGSRNHLGFALHAEEEVREHLRRSWKDLGASPECLVIVSHTSLAGCRLDIGLRFGFERLGSAVLRDFVLECEPCLVLCGHCDSRGRKSALLGRTLVVNAASDDTNPRRVHAALIELGESPIVS